MIKNQIGKYIIAELYEEELGTFDKTGNKLWTLNHKTLAISLLTTVEWNSCNIMKGIG